MDGKQVGNDCKMVAAPGHRRVLVLCGMVYPTKDVCNAGPVGCVSEHQQMGVLGCLYLFVGYRALAEYVACRKRGTATPKDAGIDGRSRAVIIVVYAAMALLIGGSMAWLSAVQPEADAEISVIKRFWELEEYVHLGWILVVALGTVVIEWVQKRARRGQG